MKRATKLDEDTIRGVAEAASALTLDRNALLSGVPIVDQLPLRETLGAQILSDLRTLNGRRLTDGSLPLAVWLANAVILSKLQPENTIFVRALETLESAPGGSAAGVNPVSLRRAIVWKTKRSFWKGARPWGYRDTEVEVSLPLHVVYRTLLLAGNTMGRWRVVTTTARELGWEGTRTGWNGGLSAWLGALWNSSWGHAITAHLEDLPGGGTRVRFALDQEGNWLGEGEWERELRVLLDPLNEHMLPALPKAGG